MVRRRWRSALLALALTCAACGIAHGVTIDWVTVGDPGNACDTQSQGCFGAVADVYRISKAEVTNAQYTEFLNAVAASDPNALYSTHMGRNLGGIARSGSPGTYTYSTIAGREDVPVNFVSFWDSLRFANWLHNGQPTGAQDAATTEDGAYALTAQGIADNSISRNPGATVFLPSEDEWYKAAYYDALSTSYFDYSAGSDTQIVCASPGSTANTANCDSVADFLTDVGSYTGSASPYGSFDQGGNIWEWNEAIIFDSRRGARGGSYANDPSSLSASFRSHLDPALDTNASVGFRVASIPEPSTALLLMTGLVPLAMRRRRAA